MEKKDYLSVNRNDDIKKKKERKVYGRWNSS